jgi:excisionase family DNA binding protein
MAGIANEHDRGETWLSLAEAAARLNVHPTTLRRWANKGEITTLITPGGHRRFAESDVARFVRERGGFKTAGGIAGVWASKAMVHVQEEQLQQVWYGRFDENALQQNQLLGQKLMGLILQYVSYEANDEQAQSLIHEAQRIGRQFGLNALSHGMSLRETLEASIFFRDSLLGTALELPDSLHIKPEANVRLMRRLTTLLNVVHLAVAEVYDDGTVSDLHRD